MNAPKRKALPPCEHCKGSREIRSAKLGAVRCPYCRRQKINRVPARELGKMLSAADARRSARAAASASVSVAQFKLPNVPAHLITSERILQRWGSDGSGITTENVDVFRQAKPPPLDPGTFTAVEQIVNASPARVRRFTYAWWRSPNPSYLATTGRKGVSKRNLGRTQVDVLNYFRDRFLASKYVDLVALVNFLP